MASVDQFSPLSGVPVFVPPLRAKTGGELPEQAIYKADWAEDWANSVVLEGISWETYERLLEDLGDDHVRVTYDQGLMEIRMSPSKRHETTGWFFGRLICHICQIQKIPVASGGATTHRRKDLAKGLEPDACFWIQHEQEMRGVLDLDLTKNPPPDLVVEVDVHSSSANRIEIYHALGVPEIWLYSRGALRFLVRDDSPTYATTPTSKWFPQLTSARVQRALVESAEVGETEAVDRVVVELGLAH